MSRRGHGEGSVYKEPNGLWTGVLELGRDASGRRVRKKVRARTKREALLRLGEVRAIAEKGLPPVDARRTLAEYLDWWGRVVLPGTVKDSTAVGYRYILARYVVPRLGRTRLSQLGPDHVLTLMRDLESDGLSPRTRRQVRAVLGRALRDALRLGYVARNVATLVDAPRTEGTRLDDTMSAEQARMILAAAEGDRLQALVEIVLSLGLRKGEALALRWDDVNLGDATVCIRGTLKRQAGGGYLLDSPKTQAGVRMLPMPRRVVLALKEHRIRQAAERLATGPAWQSGDWVFTTSIGTPLDGRNVTRWWHALCERAGIGRRRFHSSRHTAATLMREDGVPLEVISRILGHASIAITGDIYARPQPESLRRAIDQIGNVLDGRQ